MTKTDAQLVTDVREAWYAVLAFLPEERASGESGDPDVMSDAMVGDLYEKGKRLRTAWYDAEAALRGPVPERFR